MERLSRRARTLRSSVHGSASVLRFEQLEDRTLLTTMSSFELDSFSDLKSIVDAANTIADHRFVIRMAGGTYNFTEPIVLESSAEVSIGPLGQVVFDGGGLDGDSMFVNRGTLEIADLSIRNHRGQESALVNSDGRLRISNVRFDDIHVEDVDGGAISGSGQILVKGSVFSNISIDGGSGAAMSIFGDNAIIFQNHFQNLSAQSASALDVSGTVLVEASTFFDNENQVDSESLGATVYSRSGVTRIRDSVFVNGKGNPGSAIAAAEELVLTNSTILFNTPRSANHGAVHLVGESSTATLSGNIIAASLGDGIDLGGDGAAENFVSEGGNVFAQIDPKFVERLGETDMLLFPPILVARPQQRSVIPDQQYSDAAASTPSETTILEPADYLRVEETVGDALFDDENAYRHEPEEELLDSIASDISARPGGHPVN